MSNDTTNDAESIDIERMLRWLCTHANHFTITTYNGGVSIYGAWMTTDGSTPKMGDGPTLREALAAAVEFERARMSTP